MEAHSAEQRATGTLDPALLSTALDALEEHIAIVAADGAILFVNRAWHAFGALNSPSPLQAAWVGVNYLEVCDSCTGEDGALAQRVAADLRALLAGSRASFSHTYPCHSPGVQRWFNLRGARLTQDGGATPY